jgi:hypothetical protein
MPPCSAPAPCAVVYYTPSLKSARAVHSAALLALPLLLDHLPAESRLACAAVCRAWRAALADPALWLRLTLQPAARLPTSGVLAAASARAAGRLEFLDASAVADTVSEDALLAALRANPALHTLRLGRAFARFIKGEQSPEGRACSRDLGCDRQAARIAAAAPGLRCVDVGDIRCEATCALLSTHPLAGKLRVRRLTLVCSGGASDAQLAAALRAAAAMQPEALQLDEAQLKATAMEALADVAAACGSLASITLWTCTLHDAAAPALQRLLSAPALRRLAFCEKRLTSVVARALAAGLRASGSLAALTLDNVALWADADVAAPLLSAAAGHVSLRALSVCENAPPKHGRNAVTARAAAAMLAGLLSAPVSALTDLDIGSCRLKDDGMAVLIDALPSAKALRHLRMADSGVSARFADGPLARAVQAAPQLCGHLSWREAERRKLLRVPQGILDERDADDLLTLF